MTDITQQQGPLSYPMLRALLSATAEELGALQGSVQTRTIRDFNIGDAVIYLESTYGFPSEGQVYIDGHLFKYFSIENNHLGDLLTNATFVASGSVATLSDADSMGMIRAAHDAMLVDTSSSAMLNVIGSNHNVPRYYDVDDEQYRALIRLLAYMAGKGTTTSIEQFLDVVLDHQSLCGEGVLRHIGDQMVLTTSRTNVAPFGSLLRDLHGRIDVAYITPSGDLVLRRHGIDRLSAQDDTGELFYDVVLREERTPEFAPAKEWLSEMHAVRALPVIWRVVPYRIWESPYKRLERDARVGQHIFAQDRQQSVGNTVLVDVITPQPESSIGSAYVAGQMIFESDQSGGFASATDQRLRKVGAQIRFYLKGRTTTHLNLDGLREYMSAYPRQVLSVRRVVRSAVHPDRYNNLFLPVGINLCDQNTWTQDGDDFYVTLNPTVDAELRSWQLGQTSAPRIEHLRVDFSDVEPPRAGDLHTTGIGDESGESGVAGGIATAQVLPSINTRNPSFLPPFVSVSASSFPAVAGKTLEVSLSTEFNTQYTQTLQLPADATFDQLARDVAHVDADSPEYVLNFFYASGYQVANGNIYGLRLISHAIISDRAVVFYMTGNERASLFVAPVESPTVQNISFGYTMPYVSPDPFVPRQRIDYYPLYLGERNVLLLTLIGDIITVAGVIPEVTSRTYQAYSNYRQSWRMLLENKLRRLR